MPKIAKSAKVEERKVLYSEFEVSLACAEDAITMSKAKELLAWETEEEYVTRVKEGDPELDENEISFPYDFKDEDGSKVRCWNNDRNRPFDESHARKLAQDILNRKWAGPTTMPGETVNGETIIIGKTGQVESGQHRLIGLVIAYQIWAGKNKVKWHQKWATEPVLESLIVYGVSESPKVIQTLDNVKTRTLADIFYTSDLFRDLQSSQRRECARMLDLAVDLLWRRVGEGGEEGGPKKYQTHSASSEFLNRHKKLLECVMVLYKLNSEDGRAISSLKLSPGQSAAYLYLMGSSDSNIDDYRTADNPSEKQLNWDRWDAAIQFWTELAKEGKSLDGMKKALSTIVSEEEGPGGGRMLEKGIALARGWKLYKEGEKLSKGDIEPGRHQDEKGKFVLDDWDGFGGIDLGPKKPKDLVEAERESEIEEAKLKERQNRAENMAKELAKRRAEKGKSQTVAEPGSGTNGEPGKPPAPKLLSTPLHKASTTTPATKKEEEPKTTTTKNKTTTTEPKPGSRKAVEAAQTAKAKAADEAKFKLRPGNSSK